MKRDQSIDIAKAIGIILMVIGHFKGLPLWLEKWIFSFHMPLFFVLSGYLFKQKTEIQIIKGGLKSLVWPYIYTTLISVVIVLLLASPKNAFNPILGAFCGSQGNPNAKIILSNLQAGPIWFLMSLFWCRIYFSLIFKRFKEKYLFVSFLIGLPMAVFSAKIANIPLCIGSGAVSLMFYATGSKLKEIGFERIKPFLYVPIVLFWLLCSQFGYLNMACYIYQPHYLSILGGVCGSIFVFRVSSFVSGRISSVLRLIGMSTLEILCSHTFAYHSRKFFIGSLGMNLDDTFALNFSLTLLTALYSIIWILMKRFIERKKVQNA